MAEGNCIVCASPMRQPSHGTSTYCGPSCARTGRLNRYRLRRQAGWKPAHKPYVSKRKPPANACVVCGAIAKKLYCSRACAGKGKYKRLIARGIKRSAARKARGPFICQGCCKSYFATCSQKGQGEQFCSRACSTKHRFRLFVSKRELICRVWFRSCSVCSKPFTCRMPSAKYCSRRCALIYESPKCTICGAFKEGGAWYRTCGKADCDNAYAIQQRDKKREHRSALRRLRRARMKTDKATLVFRVRVFDACNWKCCSCGCDAPRRLMGTMDDNAPELDHRIALANGGTHDTSNCQLLCRVCNHFKSDRSPSEWERWKCRGQESQLQN